MSSTTDKIPSYDDEKKLKIIHQKRALMLLESGELRRRMMGFALLTTCYKNCPPDLKEYIKEKWKEEKNFKKIEKTFIKYCNKKFSR